MERHVLPEMYDEFKTVLLMLGCEMDRDYIIVTDPRLCNMADHPQSPSNRIVWGKKLIIKADEDLLIRVFKGVR